MATLGMHYADTARFHGRQRERFPFPGVCLQLALRWRIEVMLSPRSLRSAEDQVRVVNAIKQRKIPDEDLSAALKPPPELPIGIAPSQAAPPAATVQPTWPPSKPSKGKSLMVPRKPKAGPAPSRLASSSQASISQASSAPSSQTIDLTTSPARPSTSQLPASSQSQVIDLSSSPVKPAAKVGHSDQGSTEASGSNGLVAQPGTVAEGRIVKQAQEEEESEGSPEPEDDVFYLRHQDEVVGIQHYRGLVGVGERVVLVRPYLWVWCPSQTLTYSVQRREPGNRYDSNAIQVININGQQVGHIPRGTAARLGKVVDSSCFKSQI